MDNLEPHDDLWIAVIDTERRYSVWPQDKRIPLGWGAGGLCRFAPAMPGAYP